MVLETIQKVSIGLLSTIILCFFGVYIYIGLSAGNIKNANELGKHIAIIAGSTGALLILFTVLSFYYFTSGTNINYATPYLLIMTGVNSFLSLLALSVASIQVIH